MNIPANTPLVSIVMPAFNAHTVVGRAIDSVVAQSIKNWELIVVDDCSTDSTSNILNEWTEKDDRIKLVRKTINSGPASARNAGIYKAKGRFIAFLDSDDLWLPNKLAIQIAAMKELNAPISCTSYQVYKSEKLDRTVFAPKAITLSKMLHGSVIGCSTVMYDTEVLGKQVFPDNNILIEDHIFSILLPKVVHEDYSLWLKILSLRTNTDEPVICHGISETLTVYFESNQSFSSNKITAAFSQWIIYRKQFKISFIKSIYYFCVYAASGILKRIN